MKKRISFVGWRDEHGDLFHADALPHGPTLKQHQAGLLREYLTSQGHNPKRLTPRYTRG